MRGGEAPFQLLVSVFTMALVVAIAFHVLGTVSKERCAQQWDQGMAALASTIVRVGRSDYPTRGSVELRLKCGDSASHILEIREEKGPRCSRLCGEVSDTCYVLLHTVLNPRKEVVYSKPVCIRKMSPYLYYLVRQGVSGCPQGSPLFTKDLNAELPSVAVLPVYVFRERDRVQICTKQGR
ncbi:TPA: hypothetical protein EYP13_03295 [Candidatus Micrarchaeota archaeon]|nr:hypothetical protein [Candidatus Micrarchaeota archaeon]